jgi:hypothetical protein
MSREYTYVKVYACNNHKALILYNEIIKQFTVDLWIMDKLTIFPLFNLHTR